MKEQGDEKNASARLEELQKQGAAIEQAKLATERLIAEQQKLRNETNKLGVAALADAMKPLADQQGELQKARTNWRKTLPRSRSRAKS